MQLSYLMNTDSKFVWSDSSCWLSWWVNFRWLPRSQASQALSYCWKACSWQEKPTSVKSISVSSCFLLSFWGHFFFPVILHPTTYPVGIQSLWPQVLAFWVPFWLLHSFSYFKFPNHTRSSPCLSVNTKLLLKKRAFYFLLSGQIPPGSSDYMFEWVVWVYKTSFFIEFQCNL